jgi:diguanylate cyclase (GGDEF)-like protein/PAS domain S-box-containing protein
LEVLGQASRSNGVFIYKNGLDLQEPVARLRNSWMRNPEECSYLMKDLEVIHYKRDGLERWRQLLGNREIINSQAAGFPAEEQAFLKKAGVHYLILAPIFIQDRWWGVLGFECDLISNQLAEPTCNAIAVATDIIGLVIHRRNSESYLRQINADLLDMVLLTTPRGIIISASPSFKTLLGYEPEQLVGRSAYEIVYPEDVDKVKKIIRAAIASRTSFHFECRVCLADGHVIIQETSGRMLLDEDEQMIGLALGSRDVTWRKQTEKKLEEQRAMSEALRDSTAALTSTLDLQQVLHRVLSNVGKVVAHDAANIMLVDEDGKARIVDVTGYKKPGDAETLRTLRFDVKQVKNLQYMFTCSAPMAIPDVRLYDGWNPAEVNQWVRSYAAAPLRLQGQVIGFLNLDSAEPNHYTQEHAERLQVFADQAALAIRNARLFEDAQKHSQYLVQLSEMISDALGASSQEEMLASMADHINQIFQADNTHILLWDDTNHLHDYSVVNHSSENANGMMNLNEEDFAPSMQFLKTNPILVVEDLAASMYVSPRLAESLVQGSCLGMAMNVDRKNIGVTIIGFNHKKKFHEKEVALAIQTANQLTLALDKMMLLAELGRSAITDDLTGFYNRRGLNELGNREIKRALRFHRPLSAMMLDVDHFKNINDTYGHLVGDELIRGIAEMLRQGLREIDIVARYGGDEFLIMLPENEVSLAMTVAERLRSSVENASFLTQHGRLNTTISVGVTGLYPETENLSQLIEEADKAMYLAKQSGRNRVASK